MLLVKVWTLFLVFGMSWCLIRKWSNLGIFLGPALWRVKLFFSMPVQFSFKWKSCKVFAFFKGCLVEGRINKEFLSYNKNWIFPSRIEDQAFVFLRKKTEFLTAKLWVSWLPVSQKMRRTAYKQVNTDIQIFLCVENYTYSFLPSSHL